MITYINSENTTKYSRLFSEAEDALVRKWIGEDVDPTSDDRFGPIIVDPETGKKSYTHGISSLNTYFSWINDLLNISELPVLDESDEVIDYVDFDGMKFSMLPVDEEVFTINANTRTITVPTEFAKNGISVQSDEISEVVYFKIDRFYDATDLFTQNVMIEWIAPNGLKGYSVPTVKVLDSTTNYVIFGWALSSAITETAGTVTFAVRFYKYDDDNGKIQYSLSTLTQTAKIQPNIGLDIAGLLSSEGAMDGYKVLGDEIKALIKERSENSSVGVEGDKAEEPVLYFLTVDPSNSAQPYIVVLGQTADGTFMATVAGCGYSNDAGTISYFWKKFDYFTGDRVQTEDTAEVKKLAYRTIYTPMTLAEAKAESAKVPAMKFWIPKENAGKTEAYSQVDLAEAEQEGIATVYRLDAECTFDGPGYYKLVIKNRKGRATETKESDPIIVYPPNIPSNVQITERAFLDGEGAEKAVAITYVIPDDPDVEPAYTRNDPVKVGYKDNTGKIVDKYDFNPANETVAFEWHFIELGKTDDVVLEDEKEASIAPDKEGDYYCVLKGLLNGTESAPISSPKSRVTYIPAKAIYSVEGKSIVNGKDIAKSNNYELAVPEKFDGIDVGEHTIYVGRGDFMKLKYAEASMKTDSQGQVVDHQLVDELICQWYCYELQRDSDGSTTGTADIGDAILAVRGEYKPTTRTTVMYPSDYAVGEPFTLSVDNLKAQDGYVLIDDKFMPEKDGYYFCMITNKYNDKDVTVSTPLIYYDNQKQEENNQ